MQVIDANIDLRSIEYRARQSQTRYNSEFQAVLSGPQVVSWTKADVHFRLITQSVADVPARSALRASSSGDLVVPRTRRRIGDRAFSVAAPRARNMLPTQLKLLRSTNTFRRQLKTSLLQSAEDSGKQTDDCFVMRLRSLTGAEPEIFDRGCVTLCVNFCPFPLMVMHTLCAGFVWSL